MSGCGCGRARQACTASANHRELMHLAWLHLLLLAPTGPLRARGRAGNVSFKDFLLGVQSLVMSELVDLDEMEVNNNNNLRGAGGRGGLQGYSRASRECTRLCCWLPLPVCRRSGAS